MLRDVSKHALRCSRWYCGVAIGGSHSAEVLLARVPTHAALGHLQGDLHLQAYVRPGSRSLHTSRDSLLPAHLGLVHAPCSTASAQLLPEVRRLHGDDTTSGSCFHRHFCTSGPSKPPKSESDDSPGTGLSSAEVFTLANNISFARLLSGPLLAYWIMQGEWSLCFAGLALAGLSDWADGYVAKSFEQNSVLGSYLDPLADKALIACVIGALGVKGVLSPAVVGVIISRDVLLIAGGFYHRGSMLKWKVTSLSEFFRVLPSKSGDCAPRMKPTLVSKFNTVLQLALVAACIGNELSDFPGAALTTALTYATVSTTVASGYQYVQMYQAGQLV